MKELPRWPGFWPVDTEVFGGGGTAVTATSCLIPEPQLKLVEALGLVPYAVNLQVQTGGSVLPGCCHRVSTLPVPRTVF